MTAGIKPKCTVCHKELDQWFYVGSDGPYCASCLGATNKIEGKPDLPPLGKGKCCRCCPNYLICNPITEYPKNGGK